MSAEYALKYIILVHIETGMVYKLYGLTEEEMAIVEGKVK